MNKKVSIAIIAVVLIAGCGGKSPVATPDQKPTVSQGVIGEAEGTLTFSNSQYVVTGDPKFTYGLYIKNSFDPKVDVALKPLVGKEVEVYGSLASQYSGDMLLLWVNGKTIMEESEAINPQSSGGGQSFADVYKTLSQIQKDCLVKALGDTKIQGWVNNPSTFPSQEESTKISVCLSQP
ncbi:MAG: hypothetical protein ACYC06_03910 [Ilumatobacteraceae bacterium]